MTTAAEIEFTDTETAQGLFDGDTGDAPPGARTLITYLTRHRVLLGRDQPQLWEELLENEHPVTRHFHNMFVDLVIHRASKVAFKQQISPVGVPFSVTVRATSLSLEACVLVIHMREKFARAIPGEMVTLTRAEARTEMEPYWPAHVSNKAAKGRNLNAALESLAQQDLLLKMDEDQWEVSPAVALLFNAQAITRFTDLLTSPGAADDAVGTRHDAGPDVEAGDEQ